MPSDQLSDHVAFLAELGVEGFSRDPAWRRQSSLPSAVSQPPPVPSAEGAQAPTPSGQGPTANDQKLTTNDQGASPSHLLAALCDEIGPCTRCKLHSLGRSTVVFGVGNPEADLMFVGEAPGHDEDVQGIPFVGKAGQKLTQIIESIGLRREDVYIANVIKCRPPGNRNPEPDEVATCEPFLFRQIDAISPRVIVALGTFAARSLLKTDDPISRLRGRVYPYRGARLVPTFHPAYLLRNPSCRRDVWEDMKKVRALLAGADDPA